MTQIGSTWLRMLRTAVYNAYQVHIMLLCNEYLQSEQCNSWKSFSKHRRYVIKHGGGSLQSFIGNLGEVIGKLLDKENSAMAAMMDADDNDENMRRERSEYNKREAYFKQKRLIKIRTENITNHKYTRLSGDGEKSKPRHCVWCCGKDHSENDAKHYRHGRKTSYTCCICNVNLCTVVRKGEETSCFAEWHCAKELNDPCTCTPCTGRRVLCTITNKCSNSNSAIDDDDDTYDKSNPHHNPFPCGNYKDDMSDSSEDVCRYPKRRRK